MNIVVGALVFSIHLVRRERENCRIRYYICCAFVAAKVLEKALEKALDYSSVNFNYTSPESTKWQVTVQHPHPPREILSCFQGRLSNIFQHING